MSSTVRLRRFIFLGGLLYVPAMQFWSGAASPWPPAGQTLAALACVGFYALLTVAPPRWRGLARITLLLFSGLYVLLGLATAAIWLRYAPGWQVGGSALTTVAFHAGVLLLAWRTKSGRG